MVVVVVGVEGAGQPTHTQSLSPLAFTRASSPRVRQAAAGWTCAAITRRTHPDYFRENGLAAGGGE